MAAQQLTISDLWRLLETEGELHLIVERSDVDSIKKGLARKKAKQNEKLRTAGVTPREETLEFLISPTEDDKILLKCIRKGADIFKIHEVIIPSNDLG